MKLNKTSLHFDVDQLMEDVRRAVSYDEPSASLRDIENRCGVSASTLSRLDNGHIPDMETFLKLLDAFDLNADMYFVRVQWSGEVIS